MKLRKLACMICLVLLSQTLMGCGLIPDDPDDPTPPSDEQNQELPEDVDPNAVYFTVTFDVGDAYTPIPAQSVKSGETADAPTEPRRFGYVFMGWTYEGEPWSFSNTPIHKDMTLTATWGDIVYTEGLEYKLLSDGTYSVYAGDAINDTWIHVPPTHNGVAVTRVGLRGFANAKNLKSVIIPNSVTYIDRMAFSGCDSLEYMSVPFLGNEGNQALWMMFDDRESLPQSLKIVEITGNHPLDDPRIFGNVQGLTVAAIHSGTVIGAGIFSNRIRLKHVVLPQNLERIEKKAFYNCLMLASITLPETLTYIGERSFAVCPTLKEIQFEGTTEQWNAIEKHTLWIENTNLCRVRCADGVVEIQK